MSTRSDIIVTVQNYQRLMRPTSDINETMQTYEENDETKKWENQHYKIIRILMRPRSDINIAVQNYEKINET